MVHYWEFLLGNTKSSPIMFDRSFIVVFLFVCLFGEHCFVLFLVTVSSPSIGSDGNEFVRIAHQPVDVRLSGVPKLEMLAATDDCNEDAVKRDLGTACLRKAIVTSHDDGVLDGRNAQTPAANLNRRFVIRPMLSSQDGVRAPSYNRPSGIKSPALNGKCCFRYSHFLFVVYSLRTILT